jgi:SAM-dependent methyltransferase
MAMNFDVRAASMTRSRLAPVDDFPGFAFAPGYLKDWIRELGAASVADIGGGANPLLDEGFVAQNGLTYSLLDISDSELAKAPSYYRKIQADMTMQPEDFREQVTAESFDLVFSHMFLEHVERPMNVHANIFTMLKPGGVAVHFFPSANNLPLFINRITPEWLSKVLVRLFQPGRDLHGHEGKFLAYYKLCGAPSGSLHKKFEKVGYRVVRHVGYVGHSYYDNIGSLGRLERKLRPLLVQLRIPLTSCILLVLRKPG